VLDCILSCRAAARALPLPKPKRSAPASELEAGSRELSPATAKALEHELARNDDSDYEELTQEEWEEAWAKEIAQRLGDHRAGKSQKVDLGALLDDLRSRTC